MKGLKGFSLALLSLLFFANVAFSASSTCQVTNGRTGQSFSANGGGPDQATADQVATNKALAKCHDESTGWPGQCALVQCNPY